MNLVLTFCLSLMEPLPRIAIFVIVSSCSLFRELPLGPSSFPTKLNCNKNKTLHHATMYIKYAVGYAATNECYNEQFLSIKSGCYNESGRILSADVARACA